MTSVKMLLSVCRMTCSVELVKDMVPMDKTVFLDGFEEQLVPLLLVGNKPWVFSDQYPYCEMACILLLGNLVHGPRWNSPQPP